MLHQAQQDHHKRLLQDLQNDMIRNELHAHKQLSSTNWMHMKRQRILHMLKERARALQDEQLILQSQITFCNTLNRWQKAF